MVIYVFDHNLSLDRPIWTPTGIIIDHNKVKEHAKFWVKRAITGLSYLRYSISLYLVKRVWSNPTGDEIKVDLVLWLIRVVQNYVAVILVTKLSLYNLSVKSQYFSVQCFHVSHI